MKRTLALLALLTLSACRSESNKLEDGKRYPCIGINSESERDSTLRYEYSARNITVAILTAELIAPPVITVLSQLECPVAIKQATATGSPAINTNNAKK